MQTDHRHRKTALLPSLPLVAIMPGFKIVLIIHSALKSCKKYNFSNFFGMLIFFFFALTHFKKKYYYWTFIPILEHCNRSSNGLRSEAATTSSSSQQQHKYKSRFFPMRTPDLILDDKAVRQWVKTTGFPSTNTSADSTEMSTRNPRPRSMGEAMAKKPPIHPDRPSRSRSLPNHNLVVRRLSR